MPPLGFGAQPEAYTITAGVLRQAGGPVYVPSLPSPKLAEFLVQDIYCTPRVAEDTADDQRKRRSGVGADHNVRWAGVQLIGKDGRPKLKDAGTPILHHTYGFKHRDAILPGLDRDRLKKVELTPLL